MMKYLLTIILLTLSTSAILLTLSISTLAGSVESEIRSKTICVKNPGTTDSYAYLVVYLTATYRPPSVVQQFEKFEKIGNNASPQPIKCK